MMPRCEVCGTEISRRKRNLSTNKLVCNECGYYLRNSIAAVKEILRQKEIVKRYNQHFEIKMADIKHRFTNPYSAIPPDYVLQNAIYGLGTENSYTEFSKVLADYYEIEAPPYYNNPEKVPEKAIACYYRGANVVYSKGSIQQGTGFHEMWHALESFGIVPYNPETSELNAARYAQGCVSRLETKKRSD